MIGSTNTGLGSVPTAAGDGGGGDGSGGIFRVTSDDGSVVVTNPTGPTVDLSVSAAIAAAPPFLVQLSYGDGEDGTDNGLPIDAEEETIFWLGAAGDADHVGDLGETSAQRREWPTHQQLATLRLVSYVDRAQFSGEIVDVTIVVTVDGVEVDDLAIHYVDSVITADYQTLTAAYPVAPGSRVGLKFKSAGLGDGSQLRGHWRILGTVDDDLGPFISDDLTVRLETAEGHTIETDGANVSKWPNEGSIGTSHDYISTVDVDPPTLVTDADGRYIHYDGNQQLAQATIPASGEFSPPVGAQFAPFWCIGAFRVNEPGIRDLKRWVTQEVFNFIFAIDIPVSANFQLVWQYLETVGANVQTVPNVDGSLLDKWVVAEWGWDGTTFTWVLNSATVTLTGGGVLDPSGGNAAAAEVRSYIGGDPTYVDYRALFTYRVMPTAGERAKTRAYFLATYPVT